MPISYGVWRQETLDAHGGWIASAPDLAKFAAAFDYNEANDGTRANRTIGSHSGRRVSSHVKDSSQCVRC